MKRKNKTLLELSGYKKGYNADAFISDLVNYFDNEVDFNLAEIRRIITIPGKLDCLKKEAKANNTHPVTEFVKNLFKEISDSSD